MRLVNGAPHFLLCQRDDHALDLAPMAETQDVALVAAILCARGRFETGIVTKGLDQQRGIHQCLAPGNKRHVHVPTPNPGAVSFRIIDAVNVTVTIFTSLLAAGAPCGHGPGMANRRTPLSGGIFLFLGPVIGALYGIGRGAPIQWMLVGFGVGLAIALLVWLADRRKS